MDINTVYYLDLLTLCSQLDDQSVDLILCDLPYGTTACSWDSIIPLDQMWEQFNRVIKPLGAIVLTATQPFGSMLISSNIKMYKYSWVWCKSKKTDFVRAKLKPMGSHEDVLVFSHGAVANGSNRLMNYYPQGLTKIDKICKNGSTVGGNGIQGVNFLGRYGDNLGPNNKLRQEKYVQEFTGYPNTVLNFPSESKTIHPTQKPVALFEYLIRTYTKENDLVIDPCCGSGTTAIACKNTHRSYIVGDNGVDHKTGKLWATISQNRVENLVNANL